MKLKEYLEETGISIAEFSRRAGITQATVQRLMKVGNCHLNVAIGIEVLTKGKVTCRDLVDISLLKNQSNEKKYCKKTEKKHDKKEKNDAEL